MSALRNSGLFTAVTLYFLSPAAFSATLSDYTKNGFSLGASIGLITETYSVEAASNQSEHSRFQKQLGLYLGGFVWDPRFLAFGAGATLNEDTFNSADSSSDFTTIGYNLSTTWFSGLGYPLTLYANKNRSNINPQDQPSYDVNTTSWGGGLNISQRHLGFVTFNYDNVTVESLSDTSPQDEESNDFSFTGKRQLGTKGKPKSEISYGYNYTDLDDAANGSEQIQHYVYVADRIVIDNKTNVTVNMTSYKRSDTFPGAELNVDQNSTVTDTNTVQNSDFMSVSVGTSLTPSDQLRHYYSGSFTRTALDETALQTYRLDGGVNYTIKENWEAFGSAGIAGVDDIRKDDVTNTNNTNTDGADDSAVEAEQDQLRGDVLAGIRYSKLLKSYSSQSSYSASYNWPIQGKGDFLQDDTSAHIIYVNFSRLNSPKFNDSTTYRISVNQGLRRSVDSSLIFSVRSAISYVDDLELWLSTRNFSEVGEGGEQNSRTISSDAIWTRNLGEYGSGSVSTGWSETVTGGIGTQHSYLQGRTAVPLPYTRSMRASLTGRYEEESGDVAEGTTRLNGEMDISGVYGRWQFGANYRYRKTEGPIDLLERVLWFQLNRNFSTRF